MELIIKCFRGVSVRTPDNIKQLKITGLAINDRIDLLTCKAVRCKATLRKTAAADRSNGRQLTDGHRRSATSTTVSRTATTTDRRKIGSRPISDNRVARINYVIGRSQIRPEIDYSRVASWYTPRDAGLLQSIKSVLVQSFVLICKRLIKLVYQSAVKCTLTTITTTVNTAFPC